jgi:hypothetical protein
MLSHGNLVANSATTTSYYAADSSSCESFGTVNLPAVVNGATWMFNSMFALKSIGLLTLPLCTDYSYMFYADVSLYAICVQDAAACTTTTGFIQNCPALQVLMMPNLTRGINFTNSSIGNYGMNLFASGGTIVIQGTSYTLGGIGTASGAQTITITGTPFGALVTAADATAVAIALVMTTKGYTIVN